MPGSKMNFDTTGAAVAAAVKQHRERLGMGYAELSRRLTRLGRDIPTLGLRRIESAQRRVDVDDLVALATILEVSPATLLMPPAEKGPATRLRAPGSDVEARAYWNWLTASYPLRGSVMSFYSDALPPWERDEIETKLGAVRSTTT